MKATKRSILICVLTLILSVSLLAGVTFAWFTDSITNSGNTITSGELKIDATAYDRVDEAETNGVSVKIDEGNVASGTYNFEAEGTSLRNGDPVITETNWQPGDKNAKLFTVSNEGSIDAVVSLDFFVSGDLAPYLWYDFLAVNGNAIVGQFTYRENLNSLDELATSYGEVTLAPEQQVTFLFVYGLPTSATNEAMDKAVNVNVVVSARQNVEGAEGPVVVNPGTDLSTTEIDSGDTILLSEGDYEVTQPVTVNGKENVVIDGNGATITRSAASGASIMSASSKRIATAADTQTDLANNIINVSGATNVTIRNLTIVGALHHGINIWDCKNVVLENVTITDSAATAITVNKSDVTLNNVKTSGSAWGGVNVDIAKSTEEGTLTTLNVDENCAFGEYLQIYADNATIADKVTVNATGYNKYNVYDHNGTARVVWTTDSNVTEGVMFVNSPSSFSIAIQNKYDILLLTDIVPITSDVYETVDYLPAYDRANSKEIYDNPKYKALGYGVNYSGIINLNGYTLNFPTARYPVVIGQDVFEWSNEKNGFEYGTEPNNVTIKNGKLNVAGLLVLDGATLTIEDVEYNSTLTSLGVQGKNSTVNVTGSTVTSKDAFVIGTNASEKGEDGTGTHGVIVNVTNSTLKSDYIDTDSGSVTVFFNVPGNLNITDSEIYGVQNAVMVRGGTAVISGSTLTTAENIAAGSEDKYTEGNWENGNSVPYATLLVGNRTSNSYQYATSVTVTDTTITSNNAEVPAIYIWGNATEEIGATVTVDEATVLNMTGAIAGDPLGEQSNAEVIKEVTTEEGLKKSLSTSGTTKLLNDIAVTVVRETEEPLENLIVVPVGVSAKLDLNENTISLTNYEIINYSKWNPTIISISAAAKLIVDGNGTIETYAGDDAGAYGINVAGGNLGGALIVNSGTITGGPSAIQVNIGKCIINGGTFALSQVFREDPDASTGAAAYLINCIDANISNGTATININGGTFVNYDPSASQGEPNAPVNFVSEGYTVEEEKQENGETWYTVVPKA